MVGHSEDNTDRFVAYLDDEMSAEERRAFEAELAADPEFAADFARYERTVGLLRGLASPEPPRHFAEAVEGRIRRRSHGRYFALEPKMRLPYEAIAIVLLLGAMLTLFMSAGPSGEVPTRRLTPKAGEAPSAPTAFVDALRALGEVQVDGPQLHVTVYAAQLPAFQALLAKHPAWRIERAMPLGGEDGTSFILRRGP